MYQVRVEIVETWVPVVAGDQPRIGASFATVTKCMAWLL